MVRARAAVARGLRKETLASSVLPSPASGRGEPPADAERSREFHYPALTPAPAFSTTSNPIARTPSRSIA